MRVEELKKAMDQRPFLPFSIRTADGREIRVTHPDAVARGSHGARTASARIPTAVGMSSRSPS